MKLAIEQLKKKTTLIGTIKRKMREFPSSVKNKQKQNDSFFYEHDGGCLLTVYQCRADKNVAILSTHHNKPEICPEEQQISKKPNTIIDYNQTK
ncbi:unnamed protein product [Brachionus calyciflorus]|uniref:PiggyBac transposable element-derived protein domain-containing protein n=1 Tax=Brachionus calyciflorus TaxID=104777 RepID=A0A813M2Z5_9BILA|nr:unnamed protein product [Brachionus calyciflorus]